MPKLSLYKPIIACLTGNVLEWYEFSLFSTLAPILTQVFFPHQSSLIGLLIIYAFFFCGHLTRPIGSMIFGYLGDRYSAKQALIWTLSLMGLSTGLIGCLPGYGQMGIQASFGLLILRLIQGISTGGEFPGSFVVLEEFLGPLGYSGLAGALPFSSSVLGIMLGASLSHYLLNLGEPAFVQGYWRIVFWLGFVLAGLGIWARFIFFKNEVEYSRAKPINPLRLLWTSFRRELLLLILILTGSAIIQAFFTLYFPIYLNSFLHYPYKNSLFWFQNLSLLMLITVPVSAYICDIKKCHARWIKNFLILNIILVIPSFYLIKYIPHLSVFILIGLGFVVSLLIGPFAGFLVHRLSLPIRYSLFATAHGLVFSTFIGTAPFIFTLIARYNIYLWIPTYLCMGLIVSLLAFLFLEKLFFSPIRLN